MNRANGAARSQYDEMGLEFPFSETYEDEAESHGEGSFGETLETPFSESPFAEALDESTLGEEKDSWSEQEGEAYESPLSEEETFPSGLVLQPASGATGKGEEHWDPHQTGIPLLATGPDVQGQRISPHFTVKELVSSGGRAAPVARISPELVRALEAIRERAGKAVRITSGYRSWARNKAVYAARNKKPTDSRHCSGQAADISVAGLSGTQLAKLAIDAAGTNLGIGIARTFIHVDVRGTWAIWTYFPPTSEEHRNAIAAVTAHRASVLKGGTAPRPPAPLPPPQPVPMSGSSGRLVVPKHPMLRGHRGTPPDLILRWHRITQPGEIDVVVHFHGYGSTNQQAAVRIDRDKERISGLDFVNPSSPGSGGRTRPTLGILPRGHYFGGRNKNGYSFPALTPPGALQALIADALARVKRATGHDVRMGRLILTGHSGGGAPLTTVLSHTDPDEVHVFDGLYGPAAAIRAWAERRIARELASPSTLPPAMRVLYRPGSKQFPGTQPHSEALASQLFPVLARAGAARLRPFFRVELTRVDHNTIPAKFGWMLLANAQGDLPETTLFTGAPRGTRESAFEADTEVSSEMSYGEESGEAEELEPETYQNAGEDEDLAWLDVEAGEADHLEGAAEETEWNEAAPAGEEEESVLEAQEGIADRFDAHEDERDAEWALSEDEDLIEGESLLSRSGLTAAEQKAVEITSLFETGKRGGFYGLSGNFDGQGLSFGLVNWTIGTGSLQPLLRDFARQHADRWAEVFGPHAAQFLGVISPVGKEAVKTQHRFAVEVMNTSTIVKGTRRWSIQEPWVTYFKRLSEDEEFQKIQVKYVRVLLARGERFCRYFNLRSEMAYCFMFDAVSSHGQWWLTKKFKGIEKRRLLLEPRLQALTALHGEGRVPESEVLLVIADVLGATSAARWADKVRRRKRWFVNGQHPRAKELTGLEPRSDVPYTTGGSTVVKETLEESAGPAFEAEYSLASKLEAFRHWSYLLLNKVSDDLRKALAARKMKVQYAHNESYSNDLNIDLYPVRIDRFPTVGGTVMTPESFMKYVRLNLNSLLDTSLSRFHPYAIPDAAIWALDKPVGVVMKIDIPVDNAAVVVSKASPTSWMFTTVTTPATGTHPVSGHRHFFLAERDGKYYFMNKGMDMTSSGIAGLGLPIAGWFGYHQADKLWLSLQDGLMKFINANGGEAHKEARYSERIEWRYVYYSYQRSLESTFGKGAGSARNSPFFDITDEAMAITEDSVKT